MKIEITSFEDIGAIGKAVRKSQRFDQGTLGMLSGNGINFVSQLESGNKKTMEIGRVLELLETLGIKLIVDVPVPHDIHAKEEMLKYLDRANIKVDMKNALVKNKKGIISE
jgi:transcriptional regulator with XRE-family HTH domain